MKTQKIKVWVPKSLESGRREENYHISLKEMTGSAFIEATLVIEEKPEFTKHEMYEYGKEVFKHLSACKGCDHKVQVGNCNGCNFDEFNTFLKASKVKDVYNN